MSDCIPLCGRGCTWHISHLLLSHVQMNGLLRQLWYSIPEELQLRHALAMSRCLCDLCTTTIHAREPWNSQTVTRCLPARVSIRCFAYATLPTSQRTVHLASQATSRSTVRVHRCSIISMYLDSCSSRGRWMGGVAMPGCFTMTSGLHVFLATRFGAMCMQVESVATRSSRTSSNYRGAGGAEKDVAACADSTSHAQWACLATHHAGRGHNHPTFTNIHSPG